MSTRDHRGRKAASAYVRVEHPASGELGGLVARLRKYARRGPLRLRRRLAGDARQRLRGQHLREFREPITVRGWEYSRCGSQSQRSH
eukprot:3687422-Pyramimonas_sp.AAC.1